jgi:hypothetical protein
MDAKPTASLRSAIILGLVCGATAVVGVIWPTWDMFGPARKPMLQGWDDSFYYFWLPSVVIDGDVDFSNQLAHSGTVDSSQRDLALTLPGTPTGLMDNKYPPGWALGSLPFFLIAHAISPSSSTGFEPTYLLAVWLGQLFYAAVGIFVAARILMRYFSAPTAWSAALIGWLTSPLVYYQTARLSMSHSQVFMLAMVVFWITLRIREGDTRSRLWLLLGFSMSLLVVTRNVAFVYLAFPAWIIIRQVRAPGPVMWMALGAVGPAAAQMLAWKMLYGSWLAYSYGGERFDFGQLHLVEILFSPLHGWFYWHPVTILGLVGFLIWGWRRSEGRLWLASLVAIVVLSAAWPTWWLGSSFGYRGFEVATFFVMIGIACAMELLRPHVVGRRALHLCLTLAIAWNLALFGLFLTQRIPREAPVRHGQALQALWTWITVRETGGERL